MRRHLSFIQLINYVHSCLLHLLNRNILIKITILNVPHNKSMIGYFVFFSDRIKIISYDIIYYNFFCTCMIIIKRYIVQLTCHRRKWQVIHRKDLNVNIIFYFIICIRKMLIVHSYFTILNKIFKNNLLFH